MGLDIEVRGEYHEEQIWLPCLRHRTKRVAKERRTSYRTEYTTTKKLFIPIFLWCTACALMKIATEEAAGGEAKGVCHLSHLPVGMSQHHLGLAHQSPVYPCLGSLTADVLDDSTKIACGETEPVGIVVEGVCLVDMLIDEPDKAVEHFAAVRHLFRLALILVGKTELKK